MFKTRLMSSIIIMIVILTTVILGGTVLMVFLGLISLIGLFELYRAVDIHRTPLAYCGFAASIVIDCLVYFGEKEHLFEVFLFAFFAFMAVYVLAYPKYRFEQIAMSMFGIFYVSMLLSFIYSVRSMPTGNYLVWMIFIGAWGSDTCAYCTGMLIGKHRLPSQLSPKKTIEGCVGGIVGAALIGFVYATILREHLTTIQNPQVVFSVVGAAAAVISQIGDLAASAIKRNHDIKDYGNLIPGHGGIMDRFDSIIFIAPLVYFLIQYLR